ncbi:MAG: type II toxin-antitoxin system RelE/ParE family toxin [Porticoccaceae bacterium]
MAEYIARDSPWYAQAVVARLFDAAGGLTELPFRGRVLPELRNEAIRERFVYSYRLIYRVETARVTVVAVVHGHRLLGPLIERIDGEI